MLPLLICGGEGIIYGWYGAKVISFYPLSIPSRMKVLKLSSSHDKEGDAEVLLPNQIQVHSSVHRKTSLLIPGCGVGKYGIYCKLPYK